jgi:hypothetical protein
MLPSYWKLLGLVLPIFAVIAAGAGARRAGWLRAEADESLLKLVVNLLYPCLIFSHVLGNAALRAPGNLIAGPLLGFASMAGGIVFAYWVAKKAGFAVGGGLRTFAFSVGIFNYGYMAIPLVDALFGRETLGVLFVFNVGCEAAIWTVGILMLAGVPVRACVRACGYAWRSWLGGPQGADDTKPSPSPPHPPTPPNPKPKPRPNASHQQHHHHQQQPAAAAAARA